MDLGFYGTLLFVAALLVVASKAFLTVPQGYQYTKERFGKYRDTMGRASTCWCRSSTRWAAR